MTPKPKPTKADRPKKSKPNKPQRVILEKQIEAMVKLIIFWRDGQQCVQHDSDGGRCNNGLMWGHYIAQGMSNWLRLDLGNVFVQCGGHNLLDHLQDKSYSMWFIGTFGIDAAKALEAERAAHRGGKKRTIDELEVMLAHYDELYQNRYTTNLDLKSLIMSGYYGEIIKGYYRD